MESYGVLYRRLQGLDPENSSKVMEYIVRKDPAPTVDEWMTLASLPEKDLQILIQECISHERTFPESSFLTNPNPFSGYSFAYQSHPFGVPYRNINSPNSPLSNWEGSDNNINSSNGSSSSPGIIDKKPCRFFAKGYCKYGANCIYSHSDDRAERRAGKTVISNKDIAAGNFTTQSYPFEGSHENSNSTKTPLLINGSSSGFEWRSCIYFSGGSCKNGSNCNFSHSDVKRVGNKLIVTDKEIAKGSNGTIVIEGIYEERRSAVKRLVLAHNKLADKEFQNLIVSDHHPNIVRLYGVEQDKDFIYLCFEPCLCNFDDLIQICMNSSQNGLLAEDQSSRAAIEHRRRLDSMKSSVQDIKLWKANGHPSPLLLKLMRDVVLGLSHLHKLKIVHRDIKPQNLLISREGSLCAKLSDMGISKCLQENKSSLGDHATGCGSSGWQAPEQLSKGRQTQAMDLFSLGCVFFFCITGGRHPFGHRLERDMNIFENKLKNFSVVEHIPEAADLISQLLDPDPKKRLKASKVLQHPFFWDSGTRVSFLHDTSDMLLTVPKFSNLLKELENISSSVFLKEKWCGRLEPAFVNYLLHESPVRYNYYIVKDLLRFIRNQWNHYRQLPRKIQELLGQGAEAFDSYFATKFPKLLIEVYKVVSKYCAEDAIIKKYLNFQ